MFRFNVLPGPFGADAYGTTRNTSLDFSVTLGGGANKFGSSGTITITVGSDNFTKLNSHNSPVTITLSEGGSIKKYNDPNKLPTDENLTEITGTPLNPNDKLYIEATGTITTITADVTIKATVTVTSSVALGNTSLTLGGNTGEDPSSTGLGGSITPTGNSSSVTIQEGNITLKDKSLEALKSITKNAVTLSGTDGSAGFRSSASITVTRGESNQTDLSKLTVTGLQITNITGTIKNADGKTDLTTETPLSVDTKLLLDATGNLSADSGSAQVKLKGTIVVTSDNKPIGNHTLTFGGGTSNGVTGTLNLQDVNEGGKKHVKISSTSSSTLTISSDAYTAIPTEYKTTDTLKIGDPDAKSTPRNPAGTGVTGDDFTEYWELLPPDRYDSDESLEWTVVSPALMVLLIATFFPPVIVALLNRGQFADKK